MDSMVDKLSWLWLSHACGQGSRTAVSLVRAFGDADSVYAADEEGLRGCGVKLEKRILGRLLRKDTSEEKDILLWCKTNGVTVLTPAEKEYPKSLLSLRDAPMVLYSVGELPDFDNSLCCAVVGTRDMSEYGKSMAYSLGRGLVSGGACLVSGLALGIDGMAMAGAVDAGGPSVAVLGCGIDVVYPKQHEALLRRVIENGAVITEYAPGVSPDGWHFPVRNRIISGLCQAVCVVEGRMKSGSLITARHALYQGRAIYAVPGRVGDPGADGTNFLIKQGAHPLTEAEDVLSAYEFIYPHTIRTATSVNRAEADSAEERFGIGRRKGRNKPAGVKRSSPICKNTENTEIKKPGELFPPDKKLPDAPRIDSSAIGPEDLKVYESMTPDVPMLPDEIARMGFELPAVMVSLTMLEIAGAVEAGAGGYFLRRGADCISDVMTLGEDDALGEQTSHE